MQLARNLFLSPERTFHRKIQEVILLSMQIERRFTKQQIFELYANQIYLGRGDVRVRGGVRVLLQQTRQRSDAAGGCIAGRAAQRRRRTIRRCNYPERALRRRNL